MKRSISLRTFFSIYLVIAVLIVTVVLSAVLARYATAEVENDIGSQTVQAASQLINRMDAYMWARSNEIELLNQANALRAPSDYAQVQMLFENVQKHFTAFSWIGLTDTHGKVLAATQGLLVGQSLAARPVFQQGLKSTYIGDVHDATLLANLLPNNTGEPLRFVDISMPVIGANGKVTGVLAAHLSWSWATEVKETILSALNTNLDAYVVSTDGSILLGPKAETGKTFDLSALKKACANNGSWCVQTWPDGKSYITGFASSTGYMDYKGLGWTVVVREPISTAYGRVWQMQFFVALAGIFCAVLSTVICWLIAGRIAGPIRSISTAAETLSKGTEIHIPEYNGIKELEMLSVALRELLNNLSSNRKALGVMTKAASHDQLTGLHNRNGLQTYIEQATDEARFGNYHLLVMCLDLDGFKAVNDTYGHHVGDLLLQEVSARLQSLVRSSELVARLGGDEFIMIVPIRDGMDMQVARALSGRVIARLNESFEVTGAVIHVGCSVGIAFWTGTERPQAVMRHADAALYVSKKAGKNRFTFYDDLPPQE